MYAFMFKNSQTYNLSEAKITQQSANLSEAKITQQSAINMGSTEISIAGIPVVYKSQEVSEEFKGKRFIAAAVIAVSLGMSSLQTGFVLNANAEGNPITAPISAPQTPTPSATPTTNQNTTGTGGTSSSSSSIQCPNGHEAQIVNGVLVCVVNVNGNQNPSGGGVVINVTVNPVTSPEVSPLPTPAPASQPNSGGGDNGGGGNGGGGSAPSCNNEAPKAPKIISATSANKNEITLNWEKAEGPVSHYAISYGFMKGKPLYGNPNIGNVTSFTVKGLSAGVTYYFQVQAVNGCTSGPYSNEIGIKGGGKVINAPAQGFKAGVLGKTVKFQVKPSGKPAFAKPVVFNMSENTPNTGLVGKVFSFFKGLFN